MDINIKTINNIKYFIYNKEIYIIIQSFNSLTNNINTVALLKSLNSFKTIEITKRTAYSGIDKERYNIISLKDLYNLMNKYRSKQAIINELELFKNELIKI